VTETHITLYGEKSDRFEEIKSELQERAGFEPTNPDVVKVLMDESERPKARTRQSRTN